MGVQNISDMRRLGGVVDNTVVSHLRSQQFTSRDLTLCGKLLVAYQNPKVYSAQS